MSKVFDYKIVSIVVSHPKKVGSSDTDDTKFVLRTNCQCTKFRNQHVIRVIQHDGPGSDEYLRDKVIEACGGVDAINQKIANATDKRYTLASDELKTLREDPDEGNLLEMPSCQLVTFRLEHPVCMYYSADLGEHKKGELVLRKNSSYARIWDSATFLCQTFGEPVEDIYYGDGFLINQRPCELAESWMRNMTPISAVVAKEGLDVFDPMDVAKYDLDGQVHGADIPTNGGDAGADEDDAAI